MDTDGPRSDDVGRAGNRAFELRPGLTANPARNRIVRDGRAVRIEPRIMELLVYLAERPGVVVSKAQLIERVWRAHVADEAVHRAVSLLRNALGDSCRQPLLIETVPRRGYRLLVEPRDVRIEADRGAVRGRWLAPAVTAAAGVAAVFVLALLAKETPTPTPIAIAAPAEAAPRGTQPAVQAPPRTPAHAPSINSPAPDVARKTEPARRAALAPEPPSAEAGEARSGRELAPGEAPPAPTG